MCLCEYVFLSVCCVCICVCVCVCMCESSVPLCLKIYGTEILQVTEAVYMNILKKDPIFSSPSPPPPVSSSLSITCCSPREEREFRERKILAHYAGDFRDILGGAKSTKPKIL